ncbi:MAG: ROK family transcriptional regulator [Trueperaceae bacterium]
MPRGTNLEYARGYNRRIVLETIRRYGPLSRMEISQKTSLAFQTVANIIQELIERGLVITGERRQGKRGSPSLDIQINPGGAFSIGLNLDRDLLTGVLVDLGGAMLDHVQYELERPVPQTVLPLMEEIVSRFGGQVKREKLWGVAIGVPGPLHLEERTVQLPDDLLEWTNVSVLEPLEQKFGLPTFLERNANAAAIGEYWYGAGRELRSFFYVFFGIGLGSGVITDGRLHQGATRSAGKFGDIPIDTCSRSGGERKITPLKDVFSLGSLRSYMASHGVGDVDTAVLESLYDQRDKTLLEWLERAAASLAPALLSIEYLLDPQAMIFGGRLPRLIMNDVLVRVDDELQLLSAPTRPDRPRLLCARSDENAAALGLATIPLYESLAPNHLLLLKEGSKSSERRIPGSYDL